MSDAERGWGRAKLHVIGFSFVPIAISGVAHYAGVSPFWLAILAWPAILIGFIVIVTKELTELAQGKQGIGKTLIDILMMTSGLVLGVSSWLEWWV